MPNIIFIQPDKSEQHISVTSGTSVKDGAVDNSVVGIDANCGGSCACATCHIYIAPEWVGKIEGAEEEENDLLDSATNVQDNSRLSCQIVMTDAMDGLKVYVPVSA
ncbi:MAG: hypothetical protein COB46_09655 [Rhodospirillaceae bacterium]|nr:MAG: hypothetical protein COB46_09655 [Rhodospirillaceae bacterium]